MCIDKNHCRFLGAFSDIVALSKNKILQISSPAQESNNSTTSYSNLLSTSIGVGGKILPSVVNE